MAENENVCPICGGNYVYKNGHYECPYCGYQKPGLDKYTIEMISSLSHAYDDLQTSYFEKAYNGFSKYIETYSNDPQGYWGLLMSKYYIKYVRDEKSKKAIPTFYDTRIEDKESLNGENSYFTTTIKPLLENSNVENKEWYDEQANLIDKILEEWKKIKEDKENNYDIFISFKDMEDNNDGTCTRYDYDNARGLYDHLINEFGNKYKIFFSPVSIKEGVQYSPVIFNAINTSRIMIVVASEAEHAESKWVKDEWQRFLWQINNSSKNKEKKLYTICNKPQNLPPGLSDIQSFKLTGGDYITKLKDEIEELLNKKDSDIDIGNAGERITVDDEKQLGVAEKYVEQGLFKDAKSIVSKMLKNNPENPKAIKLNMLISFEANSIDNLITRIDNFKDYQTLSKYLALAEEEEKYVCLGKLSDICLKLFNNCKWKTFDMLYNVISSHKVDLIDFLNIEIFDKLILFVPNNMDIATKYIDKIATQISNGDRDIYDLKIGEFNSKCAEQEEIIKRRKEQKRKKKRKTLITSIIALIVSISIILIAVFGYLHYSETKIKYLENESGYSINIGKYFNKDDVIIPVSKDGKTITAISDYAFENNTNIKSITLPNSLISIGKGAFKGCTNLKTITFKDVLSDDIAYADTDLQNEPSLKVINESAFEGCSSLTSIDLFDSIEEIGDSAFKSSGLVTIKLPASIKKIGQGAFDNSQLESVEVCCILENANGLFDSCESLNEIKIVGKEASEYYSTNSNSLISNEKKEELNVSIDCYWEINVDNKNGDEIKNINVKINENFSVDVPSKSGYSFLGYFANNESIETKVVDENGQSLIPCDNTITNLYAKWEANTNVVTFYPGLGQGEPYTQEFKTDETKNLIPCTFVKDGYLFKGWSISKFYRADYLDCAEYTMGVNPSYALYAVWGSIEYTITYNLDGGINCLNNPSKYTIEKGTVALEEPTKDGYTFLGWDDGDSIKKEYVIDTSLKTDLTLFAKWEANTNVVTFYPGLGQGEPYTQEFKTDETNDLTPCAFIRDGYWFKGWSNSENCDVDYLDCAEYTMGVNPSYALYAVWGSIEYTITYNLDGGINSLNNPSKYTIEKGTVALEEPTKDGYTFLGWSRINSYNNVIRSIDSNVNSNITIYALWQDGEILFSIENGVCSVEGYNGSSNELIIPKYHFNKPVTKIDSYAFYQCVDLESIIIPEGVLEIGTDTFRACANLKNIIIPSTITSISSGAFCECISLANVTLPEDLLIISSMLFDNCYELANVNIPNKVTKISSHAFYNCISLKEIGIPGSVLEIGCRAFENCLALQKVSLDVGLEKIDDYAFRNCMNITSITIPSSVKSIENYAFYNCIKLVEVYNKSGLSIEKDSTQNGYIGKYAKNIYSTSPLVNSHLSIRNGEFVCYSNNGEIELISYLGESQIVEIPSGIAKIYDYAFFANASLKKITIPSSVKSIGLNAFANCSNLIEVYNKSTLSIEKDSTKHGYVGKYAKNVYSDSSDSKIQTIGDFVYYIDGETKELIWYSGNEENVTIIISDDVTSIGPYAFSCCKMIKSVVIPGSVTSIGSNAFNGCSGLTNVTLPSSVTSIGSYAFYMCSGLANIIIPDSVTSIGSYAFSYANITSIIIPDSVESLGQSVFENCLCLSNVILSNKITLIPYRTFFNCYNLTGITMPDSITNIESYAFSDCKGLTSLIIPDSVTSIGNGAFYYCDSLTNIKLSSGLTSIGFEAFSYCMNLTNITLPANLKSIGDNAFYACRKLIEVYNKSKINLTVGSTLNGYVGYYAKNIYIKDGGSNLQIANGGVYYYDNNEIIFVGMENPIDQKLIAIQEGTTQIYPYAIYKNLILNRLVLPNSITNIDTYAFYTCYKLVDIYYQGTANQWAQVKISIVNPSIRNSTTIYYYSATKPTKDGYYWHYDEYDNIVKW